MANDAPDLWLLFCTGLSLLGLAWWRRASGRHEGPAHRGGERG